VRDIKSIDLDVGVKAKYTHTHTTLDIWALDI